MTEVRIVKDANRVRVSLPRVPYRGTQLPRALGWQPSIAESQQSHQACEARGIGLRNFADYCIRVLLYAGKPNWRVLGSIVVR